MPACFLRTVAFPISPPYSPYLRHISRTSLCRMVALYLPYISTISPPYLRHISRAPPSAEWWRCPNPNLNPNHNPNPKPNPNPTPKQRRSLRYTSPMYLPRISPGGAAQPQ